MSSNAADIVDKLWRESKTLQSGGVSILHYVNELTYLLFLKMLKETNQTGIMPEQYSWTELTEHEGMEQLSYYKDMLHDLGQPDVIQNQSVRAIFTNAFTHIREPKDLKRLTTNIDRINWFNDRDDGLGDMYEGLMEKVMSDKKSKAGQYFTPRVLIDCVVRLVKPQPGEIVQDPAAGTAGFLIAADRFIKDHTQDLFDLSEHEGEFQRKEAFQGHELVTDTHRLCVMNMILHGIQSYIRCEDTCSPQGEKLSSADVILTNPPFNKMSGNVNRADFTVTANDRVGPMPFLEHAVRKLKPGGRCAIVVPDSFLSKDGVDAELRRFIMVNCNLHTVLRLPKGIFYAPGVKANVLFFTRKTKRIYAPDYSRHITKKIWFYDLRTNIEIYGKRRPLTPKVFKEFEKVFGKNQNGESPRKEDRMVSRWRCLTREQIAQRKDSLYWTWLRENRDTTKNEDISADDALNSISDRLKTSLGVVEDLNEILKSDKGKYKKEGIARSNRITPMGKGSRVKKGNILPVGWRRVRLADIVCPRKGNVPTADLGDLPFVGMKCVEAHTGRLLCSELVSNVKGPVRAVYANDILYGRLNPHLNKVCLVDFDGFASSEFIVFAPQKDVCQKFLQLILRSPNFRSYAEQRGSGDRPRVKLENVGDYEVFLPPLSEQMYIVKEVEFIQKTCINDISLELRQVLELLDRLDWSILDRAISGDLASHSKSRNRS